MKILKLILLELHLFYWQQALKQMGGDHPDAPDVVLKIRELLDQQPLDCFKPKD